MVSSMGGDSRKHNEVGPQFLSKPSSVSQAACPPNLQRFVATDRAAQRRRAIMMKAWWWTQNNNTLARLRLWYSSIIINIRQQIGTALVTGSIMIAIFMLYQWSAWLLLAVICTITCFATFQLLFEEPRVTHTEQPLTVSLDMEQPQTAPSFDFPDTPMPSTPLVRVLETIDLSSSDIEHFIRSTAEYKSEQKTIELSAEEEVAENMPVNEEPQ